MHSTNVQAAITLLKLIKATLGRVEHVQVPYQYHFQIALTQSQSLFYLNLTVCYLLDRVGLL